MEIESNYDVEKLIQQHSLDNELVGDTLEFTFFLSIAIQRLFKEKIVKYTQNYNKKANYIQAREIGKNLVIKLLLIHKGAVQ